MRQDLYNQPNPNLTGEFDLMRNDADSSYQPLQAQFRHRLEHGLPTLLSLPGRIRSTMLPPTPLTSMCQRAVRLRPRSVVHPPHFSRVQFLTTFRRHAAACQVGAAFVKLNWSFDRKNLPGSQTPTFWLAIVSSRYQVWWRKSGKLSSREYSSW